MAEPWQLWRSRLQPHCLPSPPAAALRLPCVPQQQRPVSSWHHTTTPSIWAPLLCPSGGTLTSDGEAAKETVPSTVTTPFQIAIPVHNIHAAREFFGGVLGCPEGRSAKTWVDFNLFGHRVVCHEVCNYNASSSANAVELLV